jgi:hypothetical protein
MLENSSLKFLYGEKKLMSRILLKFLPKTDIRAADSVFRCLTARHRYLVAADELDLIGLGDYIGLLFLDRRGMLGADIKIRILSGYVGLVENYDWNIVKIREYMELALFSHKFAVASFFAKYINIYAEHEWVGRASESADWHVIEWLLKNGYLVGSDSADYAIRNSHKIMLKMVYTTVQAEFEHLYLAAHTSLRSLKWLHKHVYYSADVVNRAFLIACRAGKFDCIKWFVQQAEITVTRQALSLVREWPEIYIFLLQN